MTKDEYKALMGALYKALGATHGAPNDSVNSFEIGGHSVAVVFDEAHAPDTLIVLVDVGASALSVDRALLEYNAAIPSQADGMGCYARWPDTGSVVYRTQWPYTAATKADDVIKVMGQAATVALAALPAGSH
jgi:hypothetical protein